MFTNFMNEFWNEYDTDGNGILDKNEFKIFLNDTILNEELVEGKSQEELDGEYESHFS